MVSKVVARWRLWLGGSPTWKRYPELPRPKMMRRRSVLVVGILATVWAGGPLSAQANGHADLLMVPTLGAATLHENGRWVSLDGHVGLHLERPVLPDWHVGLRGGVRAVGAACDDALASCDVVAWEVAARVTRTLSDGFATVYAGTEVGYGAFPPDYVSIGGLMGGDFGRVNGLRLEVRVERLIGMGFWAVPIDVGWRISL